MRTFITTLCCFWVSSCLLAQYKWETGVFLGGLNYQGDLVVENGPLLKETHLAGGVFVRRYLYKELAFRLGFNYGTLSGSDYNYPENGGRRNRGLSFSTKMAEIAGLLEWEPFGARRYQEAAAFRKIFSPYFFIGVAGVYQDLQLYQGSKNNDKVLFLASQDWRESPKGISLSVPVGVGLKMDVNERTTLGLQLGFGRLFHDFLDGVSLNGNPLEGDLYTFGGLTLSSRLPLSERQQEMVAAGADTQVLLPASLTAYNIKSKWELGLVLAAMNYLGDLSAFDLPDLKEAQPAIGVFLRRNLGYCFAFRLGAMYGQLKGNDRNYPELPERYERGINFNSNLLEAGLHLEWEPFGKRRYPKQGGFQKLFSPYFFVGAAVIHNSLDTDFSQVPRNILFPRAQEDAMMNTSDLRFTMPVGMGAKLDLNKNAGLAFLVGAATPFFDYMDGVSKAGNENKEDWYSFAGVSYFRRFRLKDTDADGIADADDACPRAAGNITAKGCPDIDGDGVEDLEDPCPELAGPRKFAGCPDRDNDDVEDRVDACADEAGPAATNGCPDIDSDGIADHSDPCPHEAGPAYLAGCPDNDDDGIINSLDVCPDVAGEAERQGCPTLDIDDDGVPDEYDVCPGLKGLPSMAGCIDTDMDGLFDHKDGCPEAPGIAEDNGCPKITPEAKKWLITATESVRFETGSAVLTKNSKVILEKLAAIMKDHPYHYLMISGHTDNRGNDNTNQILSEKRAQSCYDFLAIHAVIDTTKMQHKGFGETQPIGDNRTAKGRQKNRRVEFQLELLIELKSGNIDR